MQALDIIILIIIVAGAINGFMKGFIKGVTTLVGLVAGLLLARLFYELLGEELAPIVGTSFYYAKIIAFILIVLVVPIVFAILGSLLTKFFHAISLGLVNRLLGAILGAAISVLVTGVLISVFQLFDSKNDLISKTTKNDSMLYYPIQEISAFIFNGFDEDELKDMGWKRIQKEADDAIEEIEEKIDDIIGKNRVDEEAERTRERFQSVCQGTNAGEV